MMRDIIERCRENLNVVRVGDHYGFYKHADVEALLSSHSALLEALVTALPYVEMAEEDESYKNGVVAKVTRTMQSAINHATKDTTK